MLDPQPLNESKYFSTLDANRGFWQIQLNEESSKLTIFNTPTHGRMISPRDIARATDSDVVLQQVKIYIHQGWPRTIPTELLPFYSKRAALL
ncbi:hypothetical protein PR048_010221 [Dryococelus australis]|uniref:Reverse transcriptase domain-containing protein n=1 Tax=Dryococelus australis TaxID=614101 RepID=A0ABQ9I299_9NEOP|nr:hypothetical protein PR048_010221 [Dryococelus australis]